MAGKLSVEAISSIPVSLPSFWIHIYRYLPLFQTHYSRLNEQAIQPADGTILVDSLHKFLGQINPSNLNNTVSAETSIRTFLIRMSMLPHISPTKHSHNLIYMQGLPLITFNTKSTRIAGPLSPLIDKIPTSFQYEFISYIPISENFNHLPVFFIRINFFTKKTTQ